MYGNTGILDQESDLKRWNINAGAQEPRVGCNDSDLSPHKQTHTDSVNVKVGHINYRRRKRDKQTGCVRKAVQCSYSNKPQALDTHRDAR